MNTLKKVTGTWRGTYRYDAVEQIPKLVPVPFTLMLKQGWLGRFTGTVTDGPGSRPETGVVEGYFSFPRIEFTKQMPVCYVATPDGRNITLRQFLIEQGQTCERDVPHMPIFYQAEFSDARHAHGTWIIRAGRLSLLDGRAIQMPEATGGWSIENAILTIHRPPAIALRLPSWHLAGGVAEIGSVSVATRTPRIFTQRTRASN
jgi:hypothetical protein